MCKPKDVNLHCTFVAIREENCTEEASGETVDGDSRVRQLMDALSVYTDNHRSNGLGDYSQ